MSLEYLLPPGVGITSGSLAIFTKTAVPLDASADFTAIGPVQIEGRILYARIAGGRDGQDYQFRWYAQDTQGNGWERTALCLCALTS